MDSIGGGLDAFTSKEMGCFNTRVLDEHLPKAFDVVADMVLAPKLAEEEIEREKSVILEEIGMTLDNPEDLVHELPLASRIHHLFIFGFLFEPKNVLCEELERAREVDFECSDRPR